MGTLASSHGDTPLILLDWASIAWAAVLAGLTLSALTVKSRFRNIAEHGAGARVLAHALIGYFSFGMMAFGASAAASARFPVPGGAAWEGPIAVAGGAAALIIGTVTLVEHVVQVRALHLAQSMQSIPIK